LSCNSCGSGISKTKRILKVLRESETPLKPKEIAFLAKVNHSTTRSYLRRLEGKEQVERPFPQVYVATPTHVMGDDLVCVHNLVLGVDAPKLSKGIRKFEGWFGAVKLRVLFGSKRGKITGFVSCDSGMDLDKYLFVVDKFKSVIFERVGVRVCDGEVNVVTFELNKDRKDIRLDGVKSLTVKDFSGVLERIYSKDGGVRSEVKVSESMSVASVEALLKGGMTPYQILQGQALTNKKLDNLDDTLKQTNRLLANVLYELKNNRVT